MKTTTSPGSSSRVWVSSLAVTMLAACLARGLLLFGTPLMPGTNGAYYLVQARSVLAHGTLGIPDLPLVFYLQAALARLAECFGLGSREESIVLAVKLADSVLPALAALPVFLLVRRWSREASAPGWLAPFAAALATLNTPVLRMVGDFEKNSLGLVWLAALLLCLHGWMEKPSRRRALAFLGFWGLAALTHIGVFGASVVFGGLALLFFAVRGGRFGWRALVPILGAVLAVVLLAAGITLWKFDPQRIQRLALALAHPADFLSASKTGPGGGPGGGGMGPLFSGAFLLLGAVSVAALVVCWRRRELPVADTCVAAACAAGVLVLMGPWVQGDKTDRFQLLAAIPAVLAAAFVLAHWKRPRLRMAVAAAAAVGVLAPSYAFLRQGGRTVVTEAGVAELRSLAPLIEHPESTLISARHGMEWWTAWTLGTHIAQSTALRTQDWETYSAVFFLNGRDGTDGRPPGSPGNIAALSWLDRWFGGGARPGPPPGGMRGDGARPGPPPDGMRGGGDRPGPPPDGMRGGGPGGPGGPGGGGGPMDDPRIPSAAQTVHSGTHFLLARVASAPDFVMEQTAHPKK